MSRKKFTDKEELIQQLKEQLEDLRDQLDMQVAEIQFNTVEDADFVDQIEKPYNALMEGVETFLTNLSNGFYDQEESFDEDDLPF